MRKLLFVLLGIAMLGGSLYAFNHRYELFGKPADSARRDVVTRSASPQPKDRPAAQREARREQSTGPSWKLIDRALDLLNLVVGIFGIVLAVRGMRAPAGATESVRARD